VRPSERKVKLEYKRLYEKRYRALREYKIRLSWLSNTTTVSEETKQVQLKFEEADKAYVDYRDEHAEYFV